MANARRIGLPPSSILHPPSSILHLPSSSFVFFVPFVLFVPFVVNNSACTDTALTPRISGRANPADFDFAMLELIMAVR
jgi:hypothetical protein